LAQFSDEQGEVPAALLDRITDRAQGNPFYIEELLNYLQDRGVNPRDMQAVAQLELPVSLYSLILSRIDQLTESQKNTIKVASVIGRSFRASWLWGMYPQLGEERHVKRDLEILSTLDLAPVDTPEPELKYLFKHIMTQEVAYEGLPYATRAMLHERLGEFIEAKYETRLEYWLDILAFHYGRSENKAKQREYFRKAGEAAQADYNNEAALDYYQRVLPLLVGAEQIPILRRLGEVEQLVGHWQEAQAYFRQAVALAEEVGDRSAQAWCEVAMGRLLWRQSQYPVALERLEQARLVFEELGDQAGIGQVWHEEGLLAAVQGNLEEARSLWESSLKLRQELNDEVNIANMFNNLAIVARNQKDYDKARVLNEQALELRYKLGDKRDIAKSLNNLGEVLTDIGEYEIAGTQLEVAVDLQREIGDRWELANALHTLANVLRNQGDYEGARAKYDESLTQLWELGERWMLAYVLEDMGALAALQAQPRRALRLVGAGSALRKETGSSRSTAEQETLDKILAPARQTLADALVHLVQRQQRAAHPVRGVDADHAAAPALSRP
jgi:tetratricopeptide (TPR) repeat protein